MIVTKTMCMGELVARVWHGIRLNGARGLPVAHVRRNARLHGHSPAKALTRILDSGKVLIEHRDGRRWLVRGPRWDPLQDASEPR